MRKRSAFVNRTVFGRSRRSCRQCAVRLAPQEVFAEEGTALHQGIGRLTQKLFVARIIIIVPKVSSQPRSRHRVVVPRHICPFKRSGETEDIGRDTSCPTASAPIGLGGTFAGLFKQTDKIRQGFCTLRKVGRQGGPIVHLKVDIVVIVHTPRAVYIVMPHTL